MLSDLHYLVFLGGGGGDIFNSRSFACFPISFVMHTHVFCPGKNSAPRAHVWIYPKNTKSKSIGHL